MRIALQVANGFLVLYPKGQNIGCPAVMCPAVCFDTLFRTDSMKLQPSTGHLKSGPARTNSWRCRKCALKTRKDAKYAEQFGHFSLRFLCKRI